MPTTTRSNSLAVEYAAKALADLSAAGRSTLTGQSRMIAALLWAEEEAFFEGQPSPAGLTVDLATAYRDIDTKHTKRAEVTERLNFMLGHLFGLLEPGPEGWQPINGTTQAQLTAAKAALRRVLPSVAHIIVNAGDGDEPLITAEHADASMIKAGAASALVPTGTGAGRLKIRPDLMATRKALAETEGAEAELRGQAPLLLDGSTGRSIQALARVSRDRLGIEPQVRGQVPAADWQAAMPSFAGYWAKAAVEPELLDELPSETEAQARHTCASMALALFGDESGGIAYGALDAELRRMRRRKAA